MIKNGSSNDGFRQLWRLPAFALASAICASLLFWSCGGKEEVAFGGPTMGTTYRIIVVVNRYQNTGDLALQIDERLAALNQSMSTYLDNSEISRFNRFEKTGEPFPISADFLHVMETAARIHKITGGAWDPTVAPLVELWGFGRAEPPEAPPTADAIGQAQRRTGFHQIEIDSRGFLIKRQPEIQVDLASIAKGFGADAAAEVIRSSGFSDFLVEVGGEIVAGGARKDGLPWQVGINTPRPGAPASSVYRAVSLSDAAMATSGNYRQYYEIDGKRYSHIMDPRTGSPVDNPVVSATVSAPDCTFADGLATALIVLGAEKGVSLVNRLPGVECFMIVENRDGSLSDFPSDGFPSS